MGVSNLNFKKDNYLIDENKLLLSHSLNFFINLLKKGIKNAKNKDYSIYYLLTNLSIKKDSKLNSFLFSLNDLFFTENLTYIEKEKKLTIKILSFFNCFKELSTLSNVNKNVNDELTNYILNFFKKEIDIFDNSNKETRLLNEKLNLLFNLKNKQILKSVFFELDLIYKVYFLISFPELFDREKDEFIIKYLNKICEEKLDLKNKIKLRANLFSFLFIDDDFKNFLINKYDLDIFKKIYKKITLTYFYDSIKLKKIENINLFLNYIDILKIDENEYVNLKNNFEIDEVLNFILDFSISNINKKNETILLFLEKLTVFFSNLKIDIDFRKKFFLKLLENDMINFSLYSFILKNPKFLVFLKEDDKINEKYLVDFQEVILKNINEISKDSVLKDISQIIFNQKNISINLKHKIFVNFINKNDFDFLYDLILKQKKEDEKTEKEFCFSFIENFKDFWIKEEGLKQQKIEEFKKFIDNKLMFLENSPNDFNNLEFKESFFNIIKENSIKKTYKLRQNALKYALLNYDKQILTKLMAFNDLNEMIMGAYKYSVLNIGINKKTKIFSPILFLLNNFNFIFSKDIFNIIEDILEEIEYKGNFKFMEKELEEFLIKIFLEENEYSNKILSKTFNLIEKYEGVKLDIFILNIFLKTILKENFKNNFLIELIFNKIKENKFKKIFVKKFLLNLINNENILDLFSNSKKNLCDFIFYSIQYLEEEQFFKIIEKTKLKKIEFDKKEIEYLKKLPGYKLKHLKILFN